MPEPAWIARYSNKTLCRIEGEELLARAICHELDHLDGILYKDKVEDGLYKVEPVDPEQTDR